MEQQAQRLEEARLLREKHEDMLKLAKQKNDEDVQKKKEVQTFKFIIIFFKYFF